MKRHAPPGLPSDSRTPRRDAESVGVGDRFAEEVDQLRVDGRVLDPGGSKKKPHAASRSQGVGVGLIQTRQTGYRSSSVAVAVEDCETPVVLFQPERPAEAG